MQRTPIKSRIYSITWHFVEYPKIILCYCCLSPACITATQKLQQALQNKEQYLGNHMRKGILMSEHAMTTSPVESMNKLVHHGKHKVNSTMTLSVAAHNLVTQTADRLNLHQGQSSQEMNSTMLGTRAPTKTYLDQKSQYLMDRCSKYLLQKEANTYCCWDVDAGALRGY